MEGKSEVILGVLLFSSLFARSDSASNVECYSSATYIATKGERSCRLSQPNWAPETYFEVKQKHCLKNPTVNLFIRNFHGVDEINADFNKKFSRLKGTSFNGKTYQLVFIFTILKGYSKDASKDKLQVKFIYVPRFGKPVTEHLLTAVFDISDKSNCIWAETLEIYEQAFLGAGLCIGLALILGAIYFYRKCKMSQRYQASPMSEKVHL